MSETALFDFLIERSLYLALTVYVIKFVGGTEIGPQMVLNATIIADEDVLQYTCREALNDTYSLIQLDKGQGVFTTLG